MKILIVSLFLPCKTHAGGKYVYEILKGLSKNHELYLATRCEIKERGLLDEIRKYCKEVYPYFYSIAGERSFIDNLRIISSYIGFGLYADRIALKGGFDVVHAEWVEAGFFLKKRDIPFIVHAHDVITKPAERLFRRSSGVSKLLRLLWWMLVKKIELVTVNKCDMVFTLSEFDKQYLLKMAPKADIRVLPYPAGLDIGSAAYKKEPDTVLFLASFKQRKVNVEAAFYLYREVLPIVRRSIPEAKLVIAGYGPPDELKALSAGDSGVNVAGFVEDIDRCYKTAAVFAAPILVGGGIIVKILDAMAAGTPVVTTPFGNEGIGAENGKEIIVAGDAKAFAGAIVRVLKDAELAEYLSDNAGHFVRDRFGREAVIKVIEDAYSDVVRNKRR